MIAYLNTQDGIATWRAESVKASNRERVRELVGKDWSVTEIAEELGVSKGRVSQLIKELGLKAPTPKAAKDEEPQDERPETPV
jgi:predicted transcriptional regulator